MRRPFAFALFVWTLGACREAPPPTQPTAVTRPLGTWEGRGSQTLGFVSDSGRLHISWETRHEQPRGGGTFRLSLHSAVSGRPIELITETRGEGNGVTNVSDDPRPYNLMVESANVEWSISVEEVVTVQPPR